MAEVKAVTYEGLQKAHGDDAAKVYEQICKIGGFGDVGADFMGGRPPLDISGMSEAKQAQVERLIAPEESAEEKPKGGKK
jgi:hypothetical protein